MTLLFCDSFDHYTTATQKWSSVNVAGSGFSQTIGAYGRFGNGWRFNSPNAGNYDAQRTLPSSDDQFVFGTAVRFYAPSWAYVDGLIIAGFKEGSTFHVELRVNSSGQLYVTRAGTVILGPSSTALEFGTWAFVEVKGTIHESAGTVTVRINQTQVLTGSSLDTRNGGAAGVCDTLALGGSVSISFSTAVDYDDLYLCDGNGSTNNDFLGDVRIQSIFPNADGTTSDLTGSDGNQVNNYLLVDEASPDDADYVESSTVGHKDTYNYGSVTPTAGTVHGLQILTRAAKTDAGTRSVASVARLSGTEVDSADKALSTDYAYLRDIRETKPGGGAWTISDVNSAEFGVKVTA